MVELIHTESAEIFTQFCDVTLKRVTRLHERYVQGITLLCMYVVAYAGVAVSFRLASGCCMLVSHRRKGMVGAYEPRS